MRLVGSVLQRGMVSISPQERSFFPLLRGAGFQKEEHLQSRCNSWSVFCCSGHSPDFSFHPILFHLIQTNFSPQSGQQETQEWNKVACLIKGRSLSVTWQWIQTSDQNKKCNKKKNKFQRFTKFLTRILCLNQNKGRTSTPKILTDVWNPSLFWYF